MKKQVEVSIIVPCYNVGLYIDKCITSILTQGYKNFELILVNDGSTDGTLDILNEYKKKDNRIIILNKENGGVASARNYGMNNANGKYIMFVDSDDWIDSKMLGIMYQTMIDETADVVRCTRYDVYKNTLCYREGVFKERKVIQNNDKEMIYRDFLGRTRLSAVFMMLIKRELIIINNIRFNEELIVNEDELFSMEICLKSNKFIYIPEPLYFYTKRDAGLSANGVNMLKRIQSRKKHMELLKTHILDWNIADKEQLYSEKVAFECIHTALQTARNGEKARQLYEDIFNDELFGACISNAKGVLMKWPEKIILFLAKRRKIKTSYYMSIILNIGINKIYPKWLKITGGDRK